MLKRTLTILLLTLAVLPLAAFRGCSEAEKTKADRLILAFEAAKLLPAAFGIKGEQAQIVSDGFGALATAAKALRDGETTWTAFTRTFDEVRLRPSWQRLDPALKERVDAIWGVAKVLLESLRPPEGARAMGGPDFREIDEGKLRELERLTGRRK